MEENLTTNQPLADDDVDQEIDELDIEAFAGLDCKPKARRYLIRIDKKPHLIEKSTITGRELLLLAGRVLVEKWRVFQIVSGQSHELDLDEKVDVRAKGVEKFRTLSRTQTEG